MKIAVVGSRSLSIKCLEKYLPEDITEIVTGGAKGVDTCAREYAEKNHIKLVEFLPQYQIYGKSAPLKRNLQIIKYADEVFVFWDGISRGSRFVIEECKKAGKACRVFRAVPNT